MLLSKHLAWKVSEDQNRLRSVSDDRGRSKSVSEYESCSHLVTEDQTSIVRMGILNLFCSYFYFFFAFRKPRRFPYFPDQRAFFKSPICIATLRA